MTNREIRIVGRRRAEIDISRLAEALLSYVNSLSDTEKQRLTRGGDAQQLKARAERNPKGSAA